MKLDSEDQKKELLELLDLVPITNVTFGTIEEALKQINVILDPIRNAGIEEPDRSVVPIESLA